MIGVVFVQWPLALGGSTVIPIKQLYFRSEWERLGGGGKKPQAQYRS